MLSTKISLCTLVLLLVPTLASARPAAFTDPAKAGPDFAVQGEYAGNVQTSNGDEKHAAQVIALGEGKFHVVGYAGGLPGAGWDKSDKMEIDTQTKDGAVCFQVPDADVTGTIADGKITVKDATGNVIGTLNKVERKSPTLGAKPPAGAVVLFDGKSAANFQPGKMTEDGLLQAGAVSKQTFGPATIHLEFQTPFTPTGREQGRGNSGCYVNGCYEVQILDSFGLSGEDNECGGIYKVAKPLVNMAFPPLSWQTYDIDFTPAEFKDGKKVKNARATIKLNGVVIHDNLELPADTPGGTVKEGPEPGPVYLQDHGDPVRFRNIWVLPKK
jgi:hypothetical protein